MTTALSHCLALLCICLLAAGAADGQTTGTNAAPELNIIRSVRSWAACV